MGKIITFFICILVFWPVTSGAQNKVAVLYVDQPDRNDFFSQGNIEAIEKWEKDALDFYMNAGYQVIELKSDGTQMPVAERFVQTLGKLRNTKDLQVEFLSHGGIKEGSQTLYLPITGEKPEDTLTDRMIKDSLVNFSQNNKEANTTLYGIECYGARLPHALADLSRVQAFASTDANTIATSPWDRETKSFVGFVSFFQKGLKTGMSYNEAFKSAMYSFELAETTNPTFPVYEKGVFSLPRSQAEEFVAAWCENHSGPQIGNNSIAASKNINQLESLHQEKLKYVKVVENDIGCNDPKFIRNQDKKIKSITDHFRGLAIDALLKSIKDESSENLKKQLQLANDPNVQKLSLSMVSALQKKGIKIDLGEAQRKQAKLRQLYQEFQSGNTDALEKFRDLKLKDTKDQLRKVKASGDIALRDTLEGLSTRNVTKFNNSSPKKDKRSGFVNCIGESPGLDLNSQGADGAKDVIKKADERLECFKKVGEDDPIFGFSVMFEPNFGKICNGFKKTEAFYDQEGQCLERFAKESDGAANQRLGEIEKLSEQKLFDENEIHAKTGDATK